MLPTMLSYQVYLNYVERRITSKGLLERGWVHSSTGILFRRTEEVVRFSRVSCKMQRAEYKGNYLVNRDWGLLRVNTFEGLEKVLRINTKRVDRKIKSSKLLSIGFISLGHSVFKKDFGNYYIVVSVFSKETTIDGKLSDGRDFLLVRGATIRSLHEVIEFYGDKTK